MYLIFNLPCEVKGGAERKHRWHSLICIFWQLVITEVFSDRKFSSDLSSDRKCQSEIPVWKHWSGSSKHIIIGFWHLNNLRAEILRRHWLCEIHINHLVFWQLMILHLIQKRTCVCFRGRIPGGSWKTFLGQRKWLGGSSFCVFYFEAHLWFATWDSSETWFPIGN